MKRFEAIAIADYSIARQATQRSAVVEIQLYRFLYG